MLSKRRTMTAVLTAMLGLCVGASGCMTPGSDTPSAPTVRGQSPGTLPPPKVTGGPSADTVVPGKQPGHGGMPSVEEMYMQGHGAVPGPIPTELNMSSHPPYTVAPPDILLINAIRLVPRPPYKLEPLEALLINVTDTLPGQPISGPYIVTPEGTINLGFNYGSIRVTGMTLDQIQAALVRHLGQILKAPQVTVALAQFRGLQQISGEHLVRPDGTISLGSYGCVYVAGMTIGQVKKALEMHLSQYLLDPQLSVDVGSYNSKKYYIIFDGGGFGQQVYELPSTGNETVLSAISKVQGLPPVASKKKIWVARPAPCGHGCTQVMPVDWRAITEGGSTCTNYQLFPGDRIFVHANCLIEIDNYLSQVFAPIERVLGLAFLTSNTIQSFRLLGAPVTGTSAVVVP
jgi:polysaccharide export outer membrane protein